VSWKDGVIITLVACLVWFGASIVRLENQRYAYSLEMCDQPEPLPAKPNCDIETRTHWTAHLLYGLRLI
jgi:hypothetical protein